MKIICKNCNHSEKTTVELIIKIMGAMPIGGYLVWTSYVFAGTGLAMPIVVAIILGGLGMLVFKEQIVEWIVNRGYKCSNCGSINWKS